MVGVSFIKILFMHPFLLDEGCKQIPGTDCSNNGWTNANKVIECQGKLYIGDFTGSYQIWKIFPCPPERNQYSRLLQLNLILGIWKVYLFIEMIYLLAQLLILLIKENMFAHYLFFLIQLKRKLFHFNRQLERIVLKSWGFRDIKLQILIPCVDFYSECNFLGDMWRICAGNQTLFAKFVPFKIKSINILKGKRVQMKDKRFKGGILQTYTQNQTCLYDFNFPKYEKQS
ncbi:unnamed protein product [Paramecium pentaurelia]|uniref:Uncharacterized protein n=1 Tax=Paramecium pentaurelia TaxID=43138 RepID=A0A8S1YPK6_9CILI|nr:unnamed protein product [Paramecium pentaurelia]